MGQDPRPDQGDEGLLSVPWEPWKGFRKVNGKAQSTLHQREETLEVTWILDLCAGNEFRFYLGGNNCSAAVADGLVVGKGERKGEALITGNMEPLLNDNRNRRRNSQ